MTNELLKKNAEMLRIGTSATAREAERSIIDIETLQHTNQQLIATLDEVVTIQNEGARSAAGRPRWNLAVSRANSSRSFLELRG